VLVPAVSAPTSRSGCCPLLSFGRPCSRHVVGTESRLYASTGNRPLRPSDPLLQRTPSVMDWGSGIPVARRVAGVWGRDRPMIDALLGTTPERRCAYLILVSDVALCA